MGTAQICIGINVRTLDIHTSIHVNPYKHTCNSVQQMFDCMQDLLILVQTCMWINVINMEHNTNMSKPSGRYKNKQTIIMIVVLGGDQRYARKNSCSQAKFPAREKLNLFTMIIVFLVETSGMRRRRTVKSLYNPRHSCTQAKFPGREKHKLIILIIVIFV